MHLGKFLKKFQPRKLDPNHASKNSKLVDTWEEADLIGSDNPEDLGDEQRPVLDIDFPCMLFESTNGHYHLLIDKKMSREAYEKLLYALVDAGLYQSGNILRFQKDGATVVRVPWVIKKDESTSNDVRKQIWAAE